MAGPTRSLRTAEIMPHGVGAPVPAPATMWRLSRHLTVKPITNYGKRQHQAMTRAVQGNLAPLPDVRNVIAVASGNGGARRPRDQRGSSGSVVVEKR